MAIRREAEEEEYEDEAYEDKTCDGDDPEDGPLAELRRRAPDVTITVVRPGQQMPRPSTSPQMGLGKPQEPSLPVVDAYKPQAKLVPSLAQNSNETAPPASSRTILQPSRPSNNQNNSRGRGNAAQSSASPAKVNSPMGSCGQENPEVSAGSPGYTGLSNILKGMETLGTKEKEKGSQMVTIRRVMDPNHAEPTVTITLKGEKPEKDKVLLKLVNGQAVSGSAPQSGQGGKKGKGASGEGSNRKPHEPAFMPDEPPIPEGLSPDELKKYKKKQKKERQKQKRMQLQLEEEQKGRLQQLELQKQQELLRQQQEQIRQKQIALQRQEEELIKQQTNKTIGKNSKKKKTSNNNTVINTNNNSRNGNKGGKKSSPDVVSAVVYDGDDMAQSFNLPPGVTINKVAGQPGMVTISNNMGGAFSQPFLPNPNVYPSPVMEGYPVQTSVPGTGIAKVCGREEPSGLKWNSAMDANYPDKDVIVVDTNSSILGAASTDCGSVKRELTSEEKVQMAVKGLIDPSTLNMTQKKKFRKMKKAIQEEKERAEQKQREEDDLMDQMYNIVSGKPSKNGGSKVTQGQSTQVKGNAKKNLKGKENAKSTPTQGSVAKQSLAKSNKQQHPQKSNDSSNLKQAQELSRQNSKNSGKSGKESSQSQSTTSQSKKNSVSASQQGKTKQHLQQSQQAQTKHPSGSQKQTQKQQAAAAAQQKSQSQQKSKQQKSQSHQQMQPGQHQKQGQTNQKETQQQQQTQKQQQGKQAQQLQQQQQRQQQAQSKQQSHHSNHGKENVSNLQQMKQPNRHGKLPLVPSLEKQKLSLAHKANSSAIGTSIGYAPQDIAHEARYAQYLAANASTLAKMSYSSCNGSLSGDCTADHYAGEEDKKPSKRRKSRKKKGHLEDMTTIDSVFTPKDIVEGELDETERDVEAFKRFCFNNVPRHTGEKPKVNFNVKDIMIKKRPCNVNL